MLTLSLWPVVCSETFDILITKPFRPHMHYSFSIQFSASNNTIYFWYTIMGHAVYAMCFNLNGHQLHGKVITGNKLKCMTHRVIIVQQKFRVSNFIKIYKRSQKINIEVNLTLKWSDPWNAYSEPNSKRLDKNQCRFIKLFTKFGDILTCRWTDMTKLIGAFQILICNVPTNRFGYYKLEQNLTWK
jgi:hypothetical protein